MNSSQGKYSTSELLLTATEREAALFRHVKRLAKKVSFLEGINHRLQVLADRKQERIEDLEFQRKTTPEYDKLKERNEQLCREIDRLNEKLDLRII